MVVLRLIFLTTAIAWSVSSPRAEDVTPHPQAHAHNDYLHNRPLLDALDNGFCSVEADIFLVDKHLLVAHTALELSPEQTLKALYLDPLRERTEKNGGRVYRNGPEFTLLIDIKSDAETTYAALHELLSQYPDIFTHVENGQVHARPVTAVISGNRAFQSITAGSPRYAGIDGRLPDLSSTRPAHLMPLISDNWKHHFQWRGNGPLPQSERQKLEELVARAHNSRRRIRFWATPDKPEVWRVLKQAGVDLINTDNLKGLNHFLREQNQRR